MANDIRINILINRSGDPFDEIRRELRGVRDAIKETTAATEEAGKKGSTRWTELRSQLSLVRAGLREVREFAQAAWQALGEGAELQKTEQQFERLAASIGTTAGLLLGEMQRATSGMVADSELMGSAVELIALKLAKSSEEVIRLSRVSGQLGWDMNTLSLVFNNTSWKRLDTLGLAMEDVRVKFDALKKAGMDADQAFRFAVIEAAEERIRLTGDESEFASGKIRMIEAAWKEMTDELKKEFVDQIDLDKLQTQIESLTGALITATGHLGDFIQAVEFLNKLNPATWVVRVLRGFQQTRLPQEIGAMLADPADKAEAAMARLETATGEAKKELVGYKGAAQGAGDASEEAADGIDRLNQVLQERANAMRQQRGGGQEGGLMGGLGAFDAQELRDWGEGVRDLGDGAAEAGEKVDELAEAIKAARAAAAGQGVTQQLDLIGQLFDVRAEYDAASGVWYAKEGDRAGELASIQAQLAADLTDDQKKEFSQRLQDAESFGAEELAIYEATQNDLSESERQGLLARKAELEAGNAEREMLYSGDLQAQENARKRIEEINAAIAASYRETIGNVIMATGGFDQVAADWAVATGAMTQAEADMRLNAQSLEETVLKIGTAVDEGAITPEQAQQLLGPLVEAISGDRDDIYGVIADVQRKITAFVSGDWFDQLQAEEGFIDPVERKTIAMLAGAETKLGGVQGAIEGLAGATGEGLTLAESLHTELTDITGTPWDLEIDHTALDNSLSQAEALETQMWALVNRPWTVSVSVVQSGGVDVERGPANRDHATGTLGWQTVPPGFPDDSFRVGLTSGERYAVVPQGISPAGGGGYIDQRVIHHNYNSAGAVAMAEAIYDAERMKARNAFMGE